VHFGLNPHSDDRSPIDSGEEEPIQAGFAVVGAGVVSWLCDTDFVSRIFLGYPPQVSGLPMARSQKELH
jgi:hypothetical protein